MLTLPQVIENTRGEQRPGDTEKDLVLRSAMLMAIAQLEKEGQLPADMPAVIAETNMILLQYPDLWPHD